MARSDIAAQHHLRADAFEQRLQVGERRRRSAAEKSRMFGKARQLLAMNRCVDERDAARGQILGLVLRLSRVAGHQVDDRRAARQQGSQFIGQRQAVAAAMRLGHQHEGSALGERFQAVQHVDTVEVQRAPAAVRLEGHDTAERGESLSHHLGDCAAAYDTDRLRKKVLHEVLRLSRRPGAWRPSIRRHR
jgi:hypothetical protein